MTTPPTEDLRDRTRQQLLDSLGGWSGTVVAAIPPVVFVIANALSGLRQAIIAALISGVLVAAYRLVRRQPLQQAVTGLFTVAVAAAIAARTGQARGFFLVGIVGAVAYAVVFAGSLLVRRPLVGLIWEFLDPSPLPEGQRWYRVKVLRRAYDIATCAALAMFAARAIVQLSLFRHNRTGLLAVAKLAMGFPLYIAVIGVCFWVVRRARRTLPAIDEPIDASVGAPSSYLLPGAPVEPMVQELVEPLSGGTDRAPDGGLRLGQGDE